MIDPFDPLKNTSVSIGGPGSGGSVGAGTSGQVYVSNGNGMNTWVTPTEHVIQGEGIMVDIVMDAFKAEDTIQNQGADEIKRRLMLLLAEKMMACKYIEFTKMHDVTSDQYKFHARAFVVPDTKVRILRELKHI
jgi:hypothetical protein